MTNRLIDTTFSFDTCLLEGATLQRFQELLLNSAFSWSELRLEEDAKVDLGQPGSLVQVVEDEVNRPPSRFYLELAKQFGELVNKTRRHKIVELRHQGDGVCIVIKVDERVMGRSGQDWHFGNEITLQFSKASSCGQSPDRVRRLLQKGCKTLSPCYANAMTREEFYAKNMDQEGGLRGIGVDWSKAIPGLYWLNYFGPPFVRMFGREALLAAPAPCVEELDGRGVLLGLSQDPSRWNTIEYKETEIAVLDHLGRRYFFDRNHPDRPTVISKDIARLIQESPAGSYDPSKPSVLRVYTDGLD